MKNRLTVSVLALAMGFLSACSGNKKMTDTMPVPAGSHIDSNQQKLTQHKQLMGKWDVVSISVPQKTEPEATPDVFITFAESSFGGKAPCNHIGGNYTMEGDSISFRSIISTKMACGRSEQENALLNLLSNKVTTYSISENSLLLKDDSDHVVVECRKAN